MLRLLNRTLALPFALACTVLFCLTAHSQEDCAQAGDQQQIECLSKKIDMAKQELQDVYTSALAKLPESDSTDIRKAKPQLIKSQSAWQTFVAANCAYAAGAEGGSNLWVSNFESRCELQAVRDRTAFLRKEARISTEPGASNQSDSPMQPQQIINMLATPKAPNFTIPNLPVAFDTWTQDQQRSLPGQVMARCTVFWGMMNPNGKLRLVPTTQDSADNARLAIDVCLAGHMPTDWPQRNATIAEIQRILDRSTQLGEPRSLPQALEK